VENDQSELGAYYFRGRMFLFPKRKRARSILMFRKIEVLRDQKRERVRRALREAGFVLNKAGYWEGK